MADVAPMLGVLAGLVGTAGMCPYIRDTARRATCPHRGTWLIWGVLAVVVSLSQRAEGASWSLMLAGTQVALNGVVLFLALRHGVGGVSAADRIMLALAGAGVAGWVLAEEPIVAIACVIAADLIAMAMMAPKTYRDPGSETLVTFVGATVAGALAAGAVGAPDLALLLYPVYYCVANGAIVILIRHRRARSRPLPLMRATPGWARPG